ncbi:putative Aldo-keto reductase family 1 member A1 [Blattamonas nauphoetae]|uniref:Aldo-keto reductase family 1 member A1 n=1 Tax=Blattamonas nauphoetae TaxID=2049346 RepID=A0ABQ9XGI4_9EUKA|nr:putative Aldo-keto reductase family 1 member A1 [Blattamonas nauphoetae]
MSVPLCTLYNGAKIPSLGLGTWEAPPGEVGQAVKEAIKIGYRHFDFAHIYGNEKEIGQALKECFDEGLVKREELWLTSKLWNTDHRPENVLPACKLTLANLQVTYLDLYLVHWPLAFQHGGDLIPKGQDGKTIYDRVPLSDTWKAMEQLVDAGLVKNIGVSNYTVALLNDLLNYARIHPVTNQVELHPYLQQEELTQFCAQHNIHLTAYSPLARVGVHKNTPQITEQEVIVNLGKKYNKSAAQIVLRFLTQRYKNVSIIPKSVHVNRIKENFAIFDFQLADAEVAELTKLDRHFRVNDSTFFDISIFN